MEKRWFHATPALDAEIRERFEPLWLQGAAGALDGWRDDADGHWHWRSCSISSRSTCTAARQGRSQPRHRRLRSRGTPWPRALHRRLATMRVAFLYMPLMHSEDLVDQDESVRPFEAAGWYRTPALHVITVHSSNVLAAFPTATRFSAAPAVKRKIATWRRTRPFLVDRWVSGDPPCGPDRHGRAHQSGKVNTVSLRAMKSTPGTALLNR